MNTITQANQLRGFVESLKLSDNISKAQLDMLFSKLDLLIKTLDDDVWDSIPIKDLSTPIKRIQTFEEEPDDLPF
jgi:hypothetical protein